LHINSRWFYLFATYLNPRIFLLNIERRIN
jgi:hypothetical protein